MILGTDLSAVNRLLDEMASHLPAGHSLQVEYYEDEIVHLRRKSDKEGSAEPVNTEIFTELFEIFADITEGARYRHVVIFTPGTKESYTWHRGGRLSNCIARHVNHDSLFIELLHQA